MDHDQNFKNLIVDYPKQALEFFARLNSSLQKKPACWTTA